MLGLIPDCFASSHCAGEIRGSRSRARSTAELRVLPVVAQRRSPCISRACTILDVAVVTPPGAVAQRVAIRSAWYVPGPAVPGRSGCRCSWPWCCRCCRFAGAARVVRERHRRRAAVPRRRTSASGRRPACSRRSRSRRSSARASAADAGPTRAASGCGSGRPQLELLLVPETVRVCAPSAELFCRCADFSARVVVTVVH